MLTCWGEQMSKIGIMGGTFNPIHNGHISIAKAAYQQYKLDEVWFMPNFQPAYKDISGSVTTNDRYKMVQLAIMSYPYFQISDLEINRKGKTYTYETMTQLHERYPEYEFYFIMGADSLFYFDKWVHPEIILKYCKMIVAKREGKNEKELLRKIEELSEKYQLYNHFYLLAVDEIVCSSSKIRQQMKELLCTSTQNSINAADLNLCEPVFDYICMNKLYI